MSMPQVPLCAQCLHQLNLIHQSTSQRASLRSGQHEAEREQRAERMLRADLMNALWKVMETPHYLYRYCPMICDDKPSTQFDSPRWWRKKKKTERGERHESALELWVRTKRMLGRKQSGGDIIANAPFLKRLLKMPFCAMLIGFPPATHSFWLAVF